MKNILLLLGSFTFACTFLGGCKAEEQDANLTAAQTNALTQFNYATTTAFQTMDAGIYNRNSRSLPKAVADELRDCTKTPQRDGSGRLQGITVNGGPCPIRAQWIVRSSAPNVSTLDLSYSSDDDIFTQILPITIITLDGNRSTIPYGGKYKTTAVYRGSARDTSDDVVNFDVNIDKYTSSNEGVLSLDESTYTIRVTFRDFTATGRVVNNQSFFLNNNEIDRAQFEKLFFVLK